MVAALSRSESEGAKWNKFYTTICPERGLFVRLAGTYFAGPAAMRGGAAETGRN
jgi:hypothetical protein